MIPPLDLSAGETALLESCLRAATGFAGYGASAATARACALVEGAVVALDGSAERVAALTAECRRHADWTQPHLLAVDVGPVNEAGHPTDPATWDRWPAYPARLWTVPGVAEADLVLIGGRFRVACALTTLLHCRADTLILFQTYQVRREYHGFAQFARPVAFADSLTAFVRRPDFAADRARAMLDRFGLVTT